MTQPDQQLACKNYYSLKDLADDGRLYKCADPDTGNVTIRARGPRAVTFLESLDIKLVKHSGENPIVDLKHLEQTFSASGFTAEHLAAAIKCSDSAHGVWVNPHPGGRIKE